MPMRRVVKAVHESVAIRHTVVIELLGAGQTFWSEAPGFFTNQYMPESHDQLWHVWNESGPSILDAFSQDRVPELCRQLSTQPLFRFSIEVLLCQWEAFQQQRSLGAYLGIHDRKVSGSAMVGIYSSPDDYLDHFNEIEFMGYRGVKLKVTPSSVSVIAEIIDDACQRFDHVCLDANGSFDLMTLPRLQQMPHTVLIEQPVFDQNQLFDFIDHGSHTVLLDEIIQSEGDLDAFLDRPVGVMLKPVRCGGLKATMAMINACRNRQLDCGLSGYLDSGIGRYFQWVLAQNNRLTLRPDFVWSDYYFESDVCLIKPELSLADPFPKVKRDWFAETVTFTV